MDAHRVNPRMKANIIRCIDFHTSPAPGVLIGAFMVDMAMDELNVTPDMKLFGVCQTPKCLPDALQIIAGCTTGNNRLRVIPIGKFAITLNSATENNFADAIRVFIDLKKMEKFPVINAWYKNTPDFNKGAMKNALFDEIFRAGRSILSSERVRVPITQKKRSWKSITCPCCGDTVPDYLFGTDKCGGCGSLKYYEKIPVK